MEESHRVRAARTAREWLERKPVFLDTETTGLAPEDQICQVALVDVDGTVLLDTLVKPTIPISESARIVHGITDEMVAARDVPTFDSVLPKLLDLVGNHPLVIYNADYDLRMMRQSSSTDHSKWVDDAKCAMLLYAEFYGNWNDYHGNFRWQRLDMALRQCEIKLPEGMKLHSAAADAEACRLIVKHMAEAYKPVVGLTKE